VRQFLDSNSRLSEAMAEIVFMFGAGPSRHSGAPLMANFIRTAEDLRNDGTVRNSLNDVVAAVEGLQDIFAKSSFDIENIENVFGGGRNGEVDSEVSRQVGD
jgi:hypothetical protein